MFRPEPAHPKFGREIPHKEKDRALYMVSLIAAARVFSLS
jgi:hypothetical protein